MKTATLTFVLLALIVCTKAETLRETLWMLCDCLQLTVGLLYYSVAKYAETPKEAYTSSGMCNYIFGPREMPPEKIKFDPGMTGSICNKFPVSLEQVAPEKLDKEALEHMGITYTNRQAIKLCSDEMDQDNGPEGIVLL